MLTVHKSAWPFDLREEDKDEEYIQVLTNAELRKIVESWSKGHYRREERKLVTAFNHCKRMVLSNTFKHRVRGLHHVWELCMNSGNCTSVDDSLLELLNKSLSEAASGTDEEYYAAGALHIICSQQRVASKTAFMDQAARAVLAKFQASRGA